MYYEISSLICICFSKIGADPLAYTDFGINGIFYTNRISATIFSDLSVTDFNYSQKHRVYSSVGEISILTQGFLI